MLNAKQHVKKLIFCPEVQVNKTDVKPDKMDGSDFKTFKKLPIWHSKVTFPFKLQILPKIYFFSMKMEILLHNQ